MKISTLLGVAALSVAVSAPAGLVADEHEKKEETYIYATYFYCDASMEEKVDELVAKNSAPVYDAAVADGTIKGWGWLRHHTGGKWRRIQWHTSDTVEGLLSAQETIGARMDKALDGADDGFNKYCRAHDDYIWQSVAGGDGTAERGKAGALAPIPFGVTMVAPVIYTYGTEEQKARYLPRILNSDDWWCQGYSEPGSGSDLASLKTRADRDGDHYVVNGTKTWTTLGQHADWIFLLARTSSDVARKQEGISFLLIDMKSPGIKVNPIVSIDNHHSLNEVEFNEVRVPVANRIGEQDKGWTYAKALLAHERTAIAEVAESKRVLAMARDYAAREVNGGKALLADPLFQKRLSDVEIDLMALEFTELRVLASVAAGGSPGAESSLLKIKGTETTS